MASETASGGASEESVPADLPPGFFLSGVFVELRPYDVNDPNVQWIKPCTEIPEEVLGGTGLNLEFSKDDHMGEMTACLAHVESFDYWDTTILVTTGPTPVSQFVDAGLAEERIQSSVVPQAVAHQIFGGGEALCSVSVDTSRGYFSVSALDYNETKPFLPKCELALSQFESIYSQLRGKP